MTESKPDPAGDERLVLKVDGEEVLIKPVLFEVGEDLQSEARAVPRDILHFGEVLSRAEQQKIGVDSEYRAFRAEQVSALLAKDPKLSEWKVKAKIESTEKFALFKKGIATAERNVVALRAVLQALEAKMQTVDTLLSLDPSQT